LLKKVTLSLFIYKIHNEYTKTREKILYVEQILNVSLEIII